MLRSLDYGRGLIDTAIQRASAIPRSEALKRVVREKGDIRPVFAVTALHYAHYQKTLSENIIG